MERAEKVRVRQMSESQKNEIDELKSEMAKAIETLKTQSNLDRDLLSKKHKEEHDVLKNEFDLMGKDLAEKRKEIEGFMANLKVTTAEIDQQKKENATREKVIQNLRETITKESSSPSKDKNELSRYKAENYDLTKSLEEKDKELENLTISLARVRSDFSINLDVALKSKASIQEVQPIESAFWSASWAVGGSWERKCAEVSEQLKDEDATEYLKLRFLQVNNWEVEGAVEALSSTMKELRETGCLQTKYDEIRSLAEQKVFCQCGSDETGSANIYVLMGNLKPSAIVAPTQTKQFLVALFLNIFEITAPTVQVNVIVDSDGCDSKKLIDLTKEFVLLSYLFPKQIARIQVINLAMSNRKPLLSAIKEL